MLRGLCDPECGSPGGTRARIRHQCRDVLGSVGQGRWSASFSSATIGEASRPGGRLRCAIPNEVKEFEGPHLLPASPGWEKVADYALDWALEHAALPSAH